MNLSRLPKSEQEFNDIPLRLLIASMRSARESIQLKIAEAIANGKLVSSYWALREREISKVYEEMLAYERAYLDKNIPKEFMAARKLAKQYLEKFGLKSRSTRSLLPINALQVVIEDAMALFQTAVDNGKSQVRQLFRATQQRLISELQINNAIASGLIETNTVTGVKSNIEKVLYQKLVTDGHVITTNVRTGGQRSFTPEYYAEMVARTRTREAQSMGVVNMTLEYGQDLVKVSSHNTLTPICKPHEGKVYSISGSTPGYEKYEGDNRVGYHPNSASADTEILTHKGFVNIKEFCESKNECIVISSGQPYQVEQKHIHSCKYWFELKHDKLDAKLTWNHNQTIYDEMGDYLKTIKLHEIFHYLNEYIRVRVTEEDSRFYWHMIKIADIKISLLESEELAYCVGVQSDKHDLVFRRNGKEFETGNCLHVITPYIDRTGLSPALPPVRLVP